ncbi:MAG: 4-demethylwyosine synthase TYW1 [Candidatus Aenigmarchaeota archaeon]|nr:4-demethylwyosine synthase TYW1 [Candidatus Aenigmarchaeota archaeon]
MPIPILQPKQDTCDSGCNGIPDGFIETAITDREAKLDFMRQKTTQMGYRFVGRHSAIKVCSWTKESIRGKNVCYKNKFYGIESNQCVQMTPVMFFCNFNCLHCWRNFDYMLPQKEQWDEPKHMLDGCIDAQKEILQGFRGNPNANKMKLEKAMVPKHVAISLSGEPTLYPHLPEFIDEIISRKMTAFLVSNGTRPDMIENLLVHQPTNLYISFYGTNPEMYRKTAVPMEKNFWENVNSSLRMLGRFDCNTVIRLTLSKGLNFTDPKGYANIIENSGSKFIEVKAFMAVGGSRRVMQYTDMPLHAEIQEFAAQIESSSSYRIISEKPDSRVVLLAREGKNFIGIE